MRNNNKRRRRVIKKANLFHPTTKFLLKLRSWILHYSGRPFQTKFKFTPFGSSHLPNVKKGFIKGKAIRRLRTCSSKQDFESNKLRGNSRHTYKQLLLNKFFLTHFYCPLSFSLHYQPLWITSLQQRNTIRNSSLKLFKTVFNY